MSSHDPSHDSMMMALRQPELTVGGHSGLAVTQAFKLKAVAAAGLSLGP